MGKWVVTVAGIAIFSVLCDVILPEGQTRKYVKTVFGVVVTLVVVQPVIQLFNGGFSEVYTSGDSTAAVQQQFIDSAAARQQDNAIKNITAILENKGLAVENITLSPSDSSVVVQLDAPHTQQAEETVKTVVSVYFSNYSIITLWK